LRQIIWEMQQDSEPFGGPGPTLKVPSDDKKKP
jgi:hypothetical protein